MIAPFTSISISFQKIHYVMVDNLVELCQIPSPICYACPFQVIYPIYNTIIILPFFDVDHVVMFKDLIKYNKDPKDFSCSLLYLINYFKWGFHTALKYISIDLTIEKYAPSCNSCGHSLKCHFSKSIITLFTLHVTQSQYYNLLFKHEQTHPKNIINLRNLNSRKFVFLKHSHR